ncbi:gliding motility-associated ABC transporter substrate-binding protein GldG [Flavobacteriaceae bacterium]|jgi:gliding-associated putative ABC transporter substrate-binding component GldG|nr:gliding motility-associated ABC transporter substrate-binding protein GldG [Flavobacteriaceae bacterium]MDC3285580.1 gliding motility-associated ABC transporter substrate-binding protein GldG [Flavobacteriaceae bacterium]
MNKRLKHILIVAVVLILLNIMNQGYYTRIDLTKDNRYTIAKVTEGLINKIDKQLLIKVYLEGDFPSEFKRLQIETRQFLEELSAKNSQIKIQFIRPDNQREKLINAGMIPSQLTVKENGKLSNAIIFPWAEILYKNKTSKVSLLPNGTSQSQEDQLEKAIENLEFSFSNAFYKLQKEKEKKIAILSGNGELSDIQLYSFLSEVKKKYRLAKFTLDSVTTNPKKTLLDLQQFDLAIIAKPTQAFTENEKLVLDQYIINGGKTLWMIENVQADTDSLYTNGSMLAYPRDLNLTDFFFAYGLRVNATLLQDLYAAKIPLATGNLGNKPQFQNLSWFYHPLVLGNPNHAISKNILPVRLRFANQIDTLQNNLKKTPLLMSSMLTKKVGTPAIIELNSIAKEPKEEEYSTGFQITGLLTEGVFNSMYTNRVKPFNIDNFRKKSLYNKMVVISDGDIGRNQLQKGKPFDLARDKWTDEQFGNKEFLLNAVDYLLDDNGLIELRNKNIQINLLDKKRAYQEKTYWQFINITLPLLILITFGFIFHYLRKRKYS